MTEKLTILRFHADAGQQQRRLWKLHGHALFRDVDGPGAVLYLQVATGVEPGHPEKRFGHCVPAVLPQIFLPHCLDSVSGSGCGWLCCVLFPVPIRVSRT